MRQRKSQWYWTIGNIGTKKESTVDQREKECIVVVGKHVNLR